MTQCQDAVVFGEGEGINSYEQSDMPFKHDSGLTSFGGKYFSPSIPSASTGQNQSSAGIKVLLQIKKKS